MLLHQQVWGKDLDSILEALPGSLAKNLSQTQVKKLQLQEFNYDEVALLVREEFYTAISMLETMCKSHKGVLVSGQPGIGMWCLPFVIILLTNASYCHCTRQILLFVLCSSTSFEQEKAYCTPNVL